MKHAYANHYAEGRFLPSRGTARMPVVDPSTGVEAGHVASCSTEDVERAIGSARSGFQAWSRSTLDERREALGRLHAQLSARADEATRLLAQEIRIFEDGQLIAVHPVLQGRHQCSVLPGHRKVLRGAAARASAAAGQRLARAGETVARRPLGFYQAVGQRLARSGRSA